VSAAQGMLPGEPLWSGDASSGGPSGWAPYWGGRFELLQQVRLVRLLSSALADRPPVDRHPTRNADPSPDAPAGSKLGLHTCGHDHVHCLSQPDLLRSASSTMSRSRMHGTGTQELIFVHLLAQDMQSMQRRMELLRNEVMAAVASGRWQPPASDAASSVGEL